MTPKDPGWKSRGAQLFSRWYVTPLTVLAISSTLLVACPTTTGDAPLPPGTASRPSSASAPSAPKAPEPPKENKAYRLLAEQKAKSQEIDRRAVDLITADKMKEARALYKARWKELAKLRLSVVQDETLTQHEREQVDRALQADQEGVVAVLDKYEAVYGPE